MPYFEHSEMVDLGRVLGLASLLQKVSKDGGFSTMEWSAALFLLVGMGMKDQLPEFGSVGELGQFIQDVSQKIGAVLAEGRVH